MNILIINQEALQIKQYTETNLSNLKKHGINTSKYNIRSL